MSFARKRSRAGEPAEPSRRTTIRKFASFAVFSIGGCALDPGLPGVRRKSVDSGHRCSSHRKGPLFATRGAEAVGRLPANLSPDPRLCDVIPIGSFYLRAVAGSSSSSAVRPSANVKLAVWIGMVQSLCRVHIPAWSTSERREVSPRALFCTGACDGRDEEVSVQNLSARVRSDSLPETTKLEFLNGAARSAMVVAERFDQSKILPQYSADACRVVTRHG